MSESSRCRQWLHCPYVNPEVYQLYQIISVKPTEDSLNTLHTYLQDDTNLLRKNDARSLFLYYLAKCNTNKSMKNDFMAKITKSKKDFSLFSSIIIECVKEILFDFQIDQSLSRSKNVDILFPVVNTFYQMCLEKDNAKLVAVVDTILPLYDIIFDTFVEQLNEDFEETYNFKNEDLPLANHTMKQVLWIFVKRSDSNIDSYVLSFLDYTYKILSFEKIALDMKTKCGLIFVHCLGHLPDDEVYQFRFKEFPMLEVTKDPEDKENWLCGRNFKYASLLDSDCARIVLYSALFNSIVIENQLKLKLGNEKCVYQAILEELLACSNRPMKKNAEIVEISRNLLLMSEYFCEAPIPVLHNVFENCISYVSSFCDFHMDVVQKNSSLFLGHLVKVSCQHYKNGTDKFIMRLVSVVNLRDGKRKIDFITLMYLCTYMKCSFLLQNIQYLKEQISQLLEDPVCHDYACSAYELLMKEHYKEVPLEQWLSIWVRPALVQLRRVHISKTPVYQRILCRAFQINQAILRDLFPNKYMGSHREWGVLLKCLCYARNSKISISIGTYDTAIYWWGLIEKHKLKMFAVQRDDVVRVSALKAVVECQRTTEYFTEWEFSYLIDYYVLNGSNQVPHIRKEIVSLYKKAITRYFASLDVIKKQIENLLKRQSQKKTPGTEQWLNNFTKLERCYINFLRQFTSLLITNIAPDGNFYRRNSALELLMFIQPNVEVATWGDYWKNDDMDNLKQVLQDTYEINKKMAIAMLTKFDPKKFRFDDTNYYANYFSEALTLASDIKPTKSLSAAYMFQLCCYSPVLFPSDEPLQNYGDDNEMVLNIIILLTSELLGKINNDDFDDVNEAAMNSPCYGVLQCLRYLIRYRRKGTWSATYASTYALIFSICQRIFAIVLPIVSNPAPEGYLPENEETEINIRDDTVKSQRILVYAWRTVKEITLLFAEFACQDTTLEQHRILSLEQYLEIGEYFMEIFVQAKHRGVFEQAYVGFCLLSDCYWRSPDKRLNCLPEKWLRRGLDLVTGKERDDRLCSTRRSAGMPFLIMAILTTDPSLDQAAFHTTMSELTVVACTYEQDMIEYRTHALNILRFLFGHTKLGNHVSPYIERSAELALRGMQSLDWGIRNSSTLLFSALVTGLFGVQRTQDSEEVTVKNKMTVKVFSTRFPTLFDFLLVNLKAGCENNNSLVLHPILLVFSRLYPSHLDPSDTKILEAIPYIKKCLGSSSYETRKLAARASMAIVFSKDLHLTIKANFEKIHTKKVGNNECHGLLLEVWYILKFLGDQMDLQVGKIISGSIYILENAGNKFSHHCVSLYMDILSFFFGKYEERVDLDTLRKILTSISRLMEEQNMNITGRQNFEAAMVNLTVTILLNRLEHVETTFKAIIFDFENYMMVPEEMIMKTYCLQFLLYMNITYNEMDLLDPPLYIFEEMKPSDSVRDVVNNFSKPTKCEFLTSMHRFMVGYLRTELHRMELPRTSVNDCFLLNLQLLPYYPCVLVNLNNGDKQRTMDLLINFCSCDREEVISAVITCLSVLLCQLEGDALRYLDYKRLIRLLKRSCAPEAAAHRRLSVCQFLLKCKFLYYPGMRYMKSTCIVHFLNMVMTLLEDDALRIRNEISGLTDDENIVLLDEQSKSGWKCSPDKARYDFLKHCCKILPKSLCIGFLFSWCVRHFPDVSNDSSDVFERSELNSYAENIPYTQIAGKMLSLMLWAIPYGLNYDDKSIFIEEQCQMVTTILLDAFSRNAFPIVHPKTKVSVICAFRSILTYLDLNHINLNFKCKFSEYFQKKILCYFQKQVCRRDYDSVRKMFLILYHPVLLDIEYS